SANARGRPAPAPRSSPTIVVPGRVVRGGVAALRLTPHAYVPTMVGRATPFLGVPSWVGARTWRTEQCAKSQCVYPVDLGRCGSPCLPARRSYETAPQEGRSGCAARGGRLSNNEPENRPSRPGPTVLYGEFDPGSGRTLAACLTHASRAGTC